MRPTIELTGCLRVPDVPVPGVGVQAGLYKDRQVGQSPTEVFYPLRPPKNINNDPKAYLYTKVCPTM